MIKNFILLLSSFLLSSLSTSFAMDTKRNNTNIRPPVSQNKLPPTRGKATPPPTKPTYSFFDELLESAGLTPEKIKENERIMEERKKEEILKKERQEARWRELAAKKKLEEEQRNQQEIEWSAQRYAQNTPDVKIGEHKDHLLEILKMFQGPPKKLILYPTGPLDGNKDDVAEFSQAVDNYLALYYSEGKLFSRLNKPKAHKRYITKNCTDIPSSFTFCQSPIPYEEHEYTTLFKALKNGPDIREPVFIFDQMKGSKSWYEGLSPLLTQKNTSIFTSINQVLNIIENQKTGETAQHFESLKKMTNEFSNKHFYVINMPNIHESTLLQDHAICWEKEDKSPHCQQIQHEIKQLTNIRGERRKFHLKSLILGNTTIWGSYNLTLTSLENNAEFIMVDTNPAVATALKDFMRFWLNKSLPLQNTVDTDQNNFLTHLQDVLRDQYNFQKVQQIIESLSKNASPSNINFIDKNTMMFFNEVSPNNPFNEQIDNLFAELIKSAEEQIVLASMNFNLPNQEREALNYTKTVPVYVFMDHGQGDHFTKHHSAVKNLLSRRGNAELLTISMKGDKARLKSETQDSFGSFHPKIIIIDNKVAIFMTSNISQGIKENINQFYVTTNTNIIKRALRWLNLYYHAKDQDNKMVTWDSFAKVTHQRAGEPKAVHRQFQQKTDRERQKYQDTENQTFPTRNENYLSQRHQETRNQDRYNSQKDHRDVARHPRDRDRQIRPQPSWQRDEVMEFADHERNDRIRQTHQHPSWQRDEVMEFADHERNDRIRQKPPQSFKQRGEDTYLEEPRKNEQSLKRHRDFNNDIDNAQKRRKTQY